MQLNLRCAALAAAGLLLLALPAWADEGYQVSLVPCTEALCGVNGGAPLHEGSVEVDENGSVEVELEGAPASSLFCVEFLPLAGDAAVVGDLATDAAGQVEAHVGSFAPGVFMGSFLLREASCAGAPLWITAFAVSPADVDEPEGDNNDEGEYDNDGDGVENDVDVDDDNDEIDDVDDVDDDNDGIDDVADVDPDDANSLDDDSPDELRGAYQAERQELKDEYRAERAELKEELAGDLQDLREDLEDRLDDDQ